MGPDCTSPSCRTVIQYCKKEIYDLTYSNISVTGGVAEDSPKSAQPSASDLIAEKAAAKAAQKAARASQLAAVEAAAAVK